MINSFYVIQVDLAERAVVGKVTHGAIRSGDVCQITTSDDVISLNGLQEATAITCRVKDVYSWKKQLPEIHEGWTAKLILSEYTEFPKKGEFLVVVGSR